MDNTDLLSRVKQESRAQHNELERALPLNEHLTLQRYRAVLEAFLGIFDPLERQLRSIRLPEQIKQQERQRAHLLLRDLGAIGIAGDKEFPRCTVLPALTNVPRSLGCMYVLEGSRLGGRHISKLIREKLGMTEHEGCAFFSSDGSDVGPMWQSFCHETRNIVVRHEDQEEFIASAKSTFSAFITWFERNND